MLPLDPVAQSHIPAHDVLQPLAALEAGEPAQPGRVLVLGIHHKPVFSAHGVEVIHPFLVLLIVHRANVHDGVKAFPAAVNQHPDRELQILKDRILCFDVLCVALYQRVAVRGHVLIAPAFAVHGIEADPDAGLYVSGSEGVRNILVIRDAFHELLRCPGVVLSVWLPFAVFVLVGVHDVADFFIRLIDRAEVVRDILLR